MADRYREKWSREETILAFDLYCKTPFSKISKTNKKIIELASVIGRTPSSVGLKMANLAHYDPELIVENKKGMANGSKLDKEIFDEFSNNWEALSYQAQSILAEYKKTKIEELIPMMDIEAIPAGEYRDQVIKRRVGQYFFRMSVLSAYSNKCCVTGMNCPDLLIASHIKPWKDSDEKTERANPSNGLCLNALHDRAFDQGLITIDSEYRIINSKKLKDANMDECSREWFKSYDHKEIILPDKFYPDKLLIEYHNDMIFLG